MKGRDQERGSFARTGLSLSGDIPLLQGNGQRTRLNGRAKLEAHIADSRLNALIENKCVKPEGTQMILRHMKRTRKSASKACKMGHEAVKLDLYRRDSRRTRHFRFYGIPKEAANNPR